MCIRDSSWAPSVPLTDGVPGAGATMKTVTSVTLVQTVTNSDVHPAGNIQISYLAADGTIAPVTSPSAAGFGSGSTVEITFDAVNTAMIQIQIFQATSSTSTSRCIVGIGEISIFGADYEPPPALIVKPNGDRRLCGRGDVNSDFQVDFNDVLEVLAVFGLPGGAGLEERDITQDGVLDAADVREVLGSFGMTCKEA